MDKIIGYGGDYGDAYGSGTDGYGVGARGSFKRRTCGRI